MRLSGGTDPNLIGARLHGRISAIAGDTIPAALWLADQADYARGCGMTGRPTFDDMRVEVQGNEVRLIFFADSPERAQRIARDVARKIKAEKLESETETLEEVSCLTRNRLRPAPG